MRVGGMMSVTLWVFYDELEISNPPMKMGTETDVGVFWSQVGRIDVP